MQRTSPLAKAFDVNTISPTFTPIIPTIVAPLSVIEGEPAAGIFDLVPGGRGLVPDSVVVNFFGAGAGTFDARLWGWDRIGSDQITTLWVPRCLASFTCTLGAATGVAGAKVTNTDLFVHTLAVNAIGPQAFWPGLDAAAAPIGRGTIRVFSPGNNLLAWAIVPLLGCEKLQFDFDMTGATNGNALFRCLRCDEG
jgi:hypothetical protein